MIRCLAPANRRSQDRGNRRPIRRAFTLLEIIVVVTIIALLAALVAPRLLSNIGRSKTKIAKNGVAQIANQLKLYMADNAFSKLSEDTELSVLTSGTDPYLRDKDLMDPWDRPYILRVPGIENPNDFDVVSYGADGEQGGEGENEDVVN